MSYEVVVADNSHYTDEKEYSIAGLFDTVEEAVAAAKKIVDSSLDEAFKAGGSENVLYEHYMRWGADPFIKAVDAPQDGISFSAWSYAKARCAELARKQD